MAADVFKPDAHKFIFRGVNLSRPGDVTGDGFYQIATNIRSYFDGSIQSRPGFTSVATFTGQGHSVKRLNDPIAGTFAFIVGAATTLYAGSSGALTSIDAGMSGNPLTFAVVPPYQSPRPWAYVGNDLRLCKFKVGDSASTNWGIPAPDLPPDASFAIPAFSVFTDGEDNTHWLPTGAISVVSVAPRYSSSITAIIYDTGSTGWASVSIPPDTALADGTIHPGMLLSHTSGGSPPVVARILVQSVYGAIKTTTIAGIQYDSGSTGLCWVTFTDPCSSLILDRYTMVQLGSEYVVVKAVSWGNDGVPAIRVNATGTHAAGDTVTGVSSFRAYIGITLTAGQSLLANAFKATTTVAGTQNNPVKAKLTSTGLSFNMASVGGRPIARDDFMHFSILVSDITQVVEIMALIDFDATPANQDFNHNAYIVTWDQNDFAAVLSDGSTLANARLAAVQNRLQAALAAETTPEIAAQEQARLNRISSRIATEGGDVNLAFGGQTVFGTGVWMEFFVRIAELEAGRVGSDYSRGLNAIDTVQIKIKCLGIIDIWIDDWWIGGGYEPDVGDLGQSYQYIYRYRANDTGATSEWSPPFRTGDRAHREGLLVTCTASSDPQANLIDVARIGGSLNDGYRITAFGPNSATPILDNNSDQSISAATLADENDAQPFVIADLSRTGVCNVVGSSVQWVSGDVFNTAWIRNNFIFLGNTPYTFAGHPHTNHFLEINENAGTLANTPFYIPQPLMSGQPVTSIWGPFGQGSEGVYIFACWRDSIYWTQGNHPDVSQGSFALKVTSGSESLVAGCVFDRRNFVFGTDTIYEIYSNGTGGFATAPVPDANGMLGVIHNDALATGPAIYFRANDGIYQFTGGLPQSITDAQLYNLFPHEGVPGVTTNGYNPPDDTKPSHLDWYDGYLYYNYQDSGGAFVTLVYNTVTQAWCFDTSALALSKYYGEEGDGVHGVVALGTGHLYTHGGVSDAGGAIACAVDVGDYDQGVYPNRKKYGDLDADINANGVTITPTLYFDDHKTSIASVPATIAPATRTNVVLDFTGDDSAVGSGRLAKNFGLKLAWSSSTAVVILYQWAINAIVQPEDTGERYTDPDDAGYCGDKFWQGVIITANTFDVTKSITVQLDNGTDNTYQDVATLSIKQNGHVARAYSFPVGSFASQLNIAHHARLKINDQVDWMLYEPPCWVWEPSPELVTVWKTQFSSDNLPGFQFFRDIYLPIISSANVVLKITNDPGQLWSQALSYTFATTGGVHQRLYQVLQVQKGKIFEFEATSASGFRLFQKDISLNVKPWGMGAAFTPIQPFGGPSRERGASI